ncbi:unnamed protein product [Ascophyllum nodosum]
MPLSLTLGTSKSRRREAEIVLSLHVNGVPYEYGKLCEFCESSEATKHCPTDMCGFMCDSCDAYRHESRGRQSTGYLDHERAKLSKLNIPAACFRVKGFMRFVYHRSQIREEIRKQYSRFYDSRTKRHFYLFRRTQEVNWNKPRLLGREEFRPFLTPDKAAFKIQQLHRNWRAREIARDGMRAAWCRVFSPQEQRFFFFYKGKSPLVLPTTSTWLQPCRSIGGIWVWRPVLTDHVAAMRIQNMWRNFQGRRDMRRRVRQMYTLETDPTKNKGCYRSLRTGKVSSQKPVLLGSERWDPDDMLLWTVEEVVIFIRRCGLRRLAPRIRQFNIDGALLMTFDLEDFLLLGHADSVNAKRILLNIEHRPAFNGYNNRQKDLLRRAALRRRHFEEAQAEKIQRWWREMLRIMRRRQWRRNYNTERAKEERDRRRRERKTWWTEMIQDYSGLGSSAKLFGRRRNIHGVRGWGRWDPRGEQWTAAPKEVGALHRSRLLYRDTADHKALPVNIARELLLKESHSERKDAQGRTGMKR